MDDLLAHVFEQSDRSNYLNDSVLEHFHSIDSSRLGAATHIVRLMEGDDIVGLASMQVYPEYEEVHITFLEVAKCARGNGYGHKTLGGVFDHAANLARDTQSTVYVTVGGFTDKGKRSALPALRELSLEYKDKNVIFDYTP